MGTLHLLGKVEDTENHVLMGCYDRLTVCGVQQVGCGEHERPALELCSLSEGYVDSHLVTVEVGVEGLTYERMKLERLTVNENGFEGLNTESVQRRCTVQHYGVLFYDLIED